MNIVQATTVHLSLLTPLFDAYRQFYKQTSDLSGASRFLEERLKYKDSLIFLATNDSRAALGFIQLCPSFSSVSMKRLWILNDLFVPRFARSRGVAGALLERAVEIVRKPNWRDWCWKPEWTTCLQKGSMKPQVGSKKSASISII